MKKVGIIGAGKRYIDCYKDIIETLDLEIAGFVTKSGKIADEVGEYPVFDSTKSLFEKEEPDFFISVVPYYETPSIISQVCSLECDILVETPVGKASEADRVLSMVYESAILVGVVEQWPFLPMECFKKKLIDSGLLGDVHMVENDYRTYNYHGMAQLRNYIGKDAKVSEIVGSVHKNCPLNEKDDFWNITLAEFDNGKTLLFKYSDLSKREVAKGIRGNLALRVYGSKGTIISGCRVDDPLQILSLIWEDGETHNLKINIVYENDTIKEINTVLPDDSIFKWENKFSEFSFDEDQIAIAQHIEGMMDEKLLWTLEDGFKDMSLGHPSWV